LSTKINEDRDDILLCEFVVGDKEYAVVSILNNGLAKNVAIWAYELKQGPDPTAPLLISGTFHYDSTEEPAKTLLEYNAKVLDACGMFNGGCLNQIKISPRGPVLIEMNPRLPGPSGLLNPTYHQLYGKSDVDLLIDSIFDKEAWSSAPPAQTLRKWGGLAVIRSKEQGILKGIKPDSWEKITSLPSFDHTATNALPKVGGPILITHNMATLTGWVYLCSADKAAARRDMDEFHAIVEEGIFDVDTSVDVADDASPLDAHAPQVENDDMSGESEK